MRFRRAFLSPCCRTEAIYLSDRCKWIINLPILSFHSRRLVPAISSIAPYAFTAGTSGHL